MNYTSFEEMLASSIQISRERGCRSVHFVPNASGAMRSQDSNEVPISYFTGYKEMCPMQARDYECLELLDCFRMDLEYQKYARTYLEGLGYRVDILKFSHGHPDLLLEFKIYF